MKVLKTQEIRFISKIAKFSTHRAKKSYIYGMFKIKDDKTTDEILNRLKNIPCEIKIYPIVSSFPETFLHQNKRKSK